jgi:hypothetical protein
MLYQLEKEVADLRASVGGYKGANTRLQGRFDLLKQAYANCTKDACSNCPIIDKNGRLNNES